MIRAATEADQPALVQFLDRWNARVVARMGALVDARDHPAVVDVDGDLVAGACTYVVDGERCEVLTLHVEERRRGRGTALLSFVTDLARRRACGLLWVLTTNDNVDALRFYQRRGFRLAELRPGAVDEARRTLKPEIPEVGAHGIPLRDELVLEQAL